MPVQYYQDFRRIFLKVKYIFAIVVVMWVFLLVMQFWADSARPNRDASKNYTRFFIFLLSLPFNVSWKNRVDGAHIKEIEKFRARYLIFYLSALLVIILHIFLVLNFESIYMFLESGDKTGSSLDMLNF